MSMSAAVVQHWHLPLDEVMSWTWERLKAAHQQIGRERYEASVARIHEAEAAQVRAYITTNGKRPPELKTYDQIMIDPWAEPVTSDDGAASELWAIYDAQNNGDD